MGLGNNFTPYLLFPADTKTNKKQPPGGMMLVVVASPSRMQGTPVQIPARVQ
jgi:hypothetical protein